MFTSRAANPTGDSLSLEELTLLPMATGMMKNNLFAQRKKAQAKATKRMKETPIIKSPRTQLLENQARMKEFAREQQERIEKSRAQLQQAIEERQKREALAREDQRRAMEQSERPNEEERQDNLNESSNHSSSVRRKVPSKRYGLSNPSTAPATQVKPQLPRPSFVDPPMYTSVSSMSATAVPAENLQEVKQMVESGIETSVFCAPYADGRIRTWDDLAMPDESSVWSTDYKNWCNSEAWSSMAWEYESGNPKKLVSMSHFGNYNNILKISAGTPVSNPSLWPPQLTAMGIETIVPRSDVLPQSDYILRITRTDPFGGSSSSGSQVYRSMTLNQVVDEMALSLLAASQGIGPPVYACVAWKWKNQEGKAKPLYGMTMILRRADGDMMTYVEKLRADFPRTTQGPSNGMIRMSEETAINTIGLCFHMGWMGLINFDMKPANMLMSEREGMFYLSDFDGVLCRQVDPEDGGVKTCFFVNLLLMCFHVQSYIASVTFTSAFLATAAPILVELWTEAVRSPSSFGPGAEWLKQAVITNTEEGIFDQGTLARMPPKKSLATQLKMMVYEYAFATGEGRRPGPKIKSFAWDTSEDYFSGPAALVPQLMKYVVMYNSAVPEEFSDIFAAR